MQVISGPEALAFRHLLNKPPRALAVAVSGGPDSMALLHFLSVLLAQHKKKTRIHAVTVDHGLRPEAAAEAAQVGIWVQDWAQVTHHVVQWKGRKPASSIQERAREKRYELLADFCAEKKIRHLYLAHHQSDQAETFLFRLAKGSGLDGLSCMTAEAPYRDTDLLLCRPFLDVPKTALEHYCRSHAIPFVADPGNENRDYARIRLRQAMPVLEAEGLSEKRLAVTAARLQRARAALDFYAAKIIRSAVTIEHDRAAIRLSTLRSAPEEIRLRVVRQVIATMGDDGYGPRLERLEDLLAEVFTAPKEARKFTLGGFLFFSQVKTGLFVVQREKASHNHSK